MKFALALSALAFLFVLYALAMTMAATRETAALLKRTNELLEKRGQS
jgi:hypothetical protein